MILLYHLIFPDDTPKTAWNAGNIIRLKDFERQILWLKKHYQIVSLDEFFNEFTQGKKSEIRKLAITFDDGYASTFELVSPFLLRENVPVTFFVSTSHLEDGQLLWFVYINALCSEQTYPEILFDERTYILDNNKTRYRVWQLLIRLARESGDAVGFTRELAKSYPLPEKVHQKYQGMTEQQIISISNSTLFDLGGHTHNHPYLDQLNYQEQVNQIQKNKDILTRISSKEIKYFAYTGGIYNEDSLAAVKQSGIMAGLAVRPKNQGTNISYEIPRTGIYSPSLIKFKLKVTGFVDYAQRLLPAG